jgi:hypothetical protein
MNFWRGLIPVIFLLSSLLSFGQQEDNLAFNKKVTLDVKSETIAAVLEQITEQIHYFFSYDPVTVNADKKIDLSVKETPLKDVLDRIFDRRFLFQVLQDQIIITRQQSVNFSAEKEEKPENKPVYLTIAGKVVEKDTNDPVSWASVSLFGKAIGTISNVDGDFEIKIADSLRVDTVVFSCLGYKQQKFRAETLIQDNLRVYMQPVPIKLSEVKVTAVDPELVIEKMLGKVSQNYTGAPVIMTSFYREVLKQDKDYINVSEAVMEILKASYEDPNKEDRVKFIKGRKSPDVRPFQWVDFKIQGGPYYITKLDVIKTMDTFLDPEFRSYYRYSVEQVIDYNDRDTYVIRFKPKEKVNYPCYEGKLFVDMDSYALVHAEFGLGRVGLKFARKSLIKKKPKNFNVRPLDVNYEVTYRNFDGKWYFNTAKTSVKFRVRSKNDNINSIFHSTSDLLVTDLRKDDGVRYKKNELFSPKDIFTDIIVGYDKDFWGDYNIIQPSEDLRKALKKFYNKSESRGVPDAPDSHNDPDNIKFSAN